MRLEEIEALSLRKFLYYLRALAKRNAANSGGATADDDPEDPYVRAAESAILDPALAL